MLNISIDTIGVITQENDKINSLLTNCMVLDDSYSLRAFEKQVIFLLPQFIINSYEERENEDIVFYL